MAAIFFNLFQCCIQDTSDGCQLPPPHLTKSGRGLLAVKMMKTITSFSLWMAHTLIVGLMS